MKRLRWLLTVVTLILIALDCLSSWRQFGYGLQADESAGRDYFGMICTSGAMKLIRYNAIDAENFLDANGFRWEVPVHERNPCVLGFSRDVAGTTVEFPLWPITFALGILSLLAWRSYRNARRTGFCNKCGYDLSGNLSAVCPECGTPITLKPPASNGTT